MVDVAEDDGDLDVPLVGEDEALLDGELVSEGERVELLEVIAVPDGKPEVEEDAVREGEPDVEREERGVKDADVDPVETLETDEDAVALAHVVVEREITAEDDALGDSVDERELAAEDDALGDTVDERDMAADRDTSIDVVEETDNRLERVREGLALVEIDLCALRDSVFAPDTDFEGRVLKDIEPVADGDVLVRGDLEKVPPDEGDFDELSELDVIPEKLYEADSVESTVFVLIVVPETVDVRVSRRDKDC